MSKYYGADYEDQVARKNGAEKNANADCDKAAEVARRPVVDEICGAT